MTVTAKWGLPIQLDVLFEQLKKHLIPIGYYGPGVLKFEHKGQVFGACHKDLFTNRKATDKSFYNQSTIVLRQPFSGGWKELNMKLFPIGSIQMTGVTDQAFAVKAVEWLLAFIETLPQSPFAGKAAVTNVDISLINTDYSLSHDVQQDNLHKLLMERYNLFSMLEKTIYQGINTKFFYNTKNNGTGICSCKGFCKGQGTGDGEGECKRITMSIFRTGKIIITGARTMDQIEAAYAFLNKVFLEHATDVLLARS
jgi:Transcription factor TFIID (or TATA-binding protein, TBP)